MKITYIGHATTLIHLAGLTILTDPWLTGRCYGFLKRRRPLGQAVEQCAKIDLILASHLHSDHLHPPSLRLLQGKSALILGPKGLGKKIKGSGFERYQELEAWQDIEFEGLKISTVPAKHPGKGLGFVIAGEGGEGKGKKNTNLKHIYFAGDTLCFPEMEKIKDKFDLHVALLPIGGASALGRRIVMGPKEAAQALRMLRPKVAIPIHWGSFLSVPPLFSMKGQPEEFKGLAKQEAKGIKVVLLKEGQSWTM